MEKSKKNQIKKKLLCVLKDLLENAGSIIDNCGDYCSGVKIVIRDLGPQDIPMWKVTYTHTSKNFIENNKKE